MPDRAVIARRILGEMFKRAGRRELKEPMVCRVVVSGNAVNCSDRSNDNQRITRRILVWVIKLFDLGLLVGVTGFEPATSSSRTKHATKLRHTPIASSG